MRWEPGKESDDIVDRRGEGPTGGGGGGGGLGLLLWLVPWLWRSTLGRIVLVIIVLVMIGNAAWNALTGGGVVAPGGALHGGTASSATPGGAAAERQVQFVSFVLDDVQKTWDRELPAQKKGTAYHHAKLVLFTES